MRTTITRYPGEYVDIEHWFIGVTEIFENRAMLHIGCAHEDTVVTVTDGEAYAAPDGSTLLVATMGYDSEGNSCCTLGFLTTDEVTPLRSERGGRLQ